MLRSCYKTLMRFPSGGGYVEIPVRWFFADDLPWFVGKTPYASINYRGIKELPEQGEGEVVGATRQWVNGANPNPDCCKRPKQFGGMIAGGITPHWLDYGWEGGAGIEWNGVGKWGSGFAGSAGLMLDGVGTFGSGWTAGEGGMEYGGAGSFGSGWTAGEGGMAYDGRGTFATGSSTPPYGLEYDGKGDFGSGFAGVAGMLFNGAGVFAEGFVGFGGLLWNGEGDFGGDTPMAETTGIIVFYGGGEAPSGWLSCNGQAVSRTTYAALFACIGTTFGVGDGSSTFNVPDCRSRFPRATGTGTGLSNVSQNATGGAESKTLTSADIPAHTHGLATGGLSGLAGATTYVQGPGSSVQTGSYGGGGSFSLMNPWIGLNCIIKT